MFLWLLYKCSEFTVKKKKKKHTKKCLIMVVMNSPESQGIW